VELVEPERQQEEAEEEAEGVVLSVQWDHRTPMRKV
jgi:hypothetical protein